MTKRSATGERELSQKRKMMWGALGVFLGVSAVIVIVNSLLRGFMSRYTISRYVGLETWSAVVFLVANFIVMGLMAEYLYMMGRRWGMKKMYFWMVVVMGMMLIVLSAFPVGYFDVGGVKSVPSRVHETAARLMFAIMMVIAVMLAVSKQATRRTRVLAGVFVIYGLVCAVANFGEWVWFMQGLLIFESIYLLGFMGFCAMIQEKTEVGERKK